MIFYNSARRLPRNFATMKSTIIIVALTISFALTGNACHSQTADIHLTDQKMETKNKNVVKSIFEQALNKRKMDLLKNLVHETYTNVRGGKGPDGFAAAVQPLLTAFPDIEWTITDIVAEGNKVMTRMVWKGTHNGTFTKYPATGKAITNEGMAVYELKDGKVISATAFPDRLAFFQQIGVVPADL